MRLVIVIVLICPALLLAIGIGNVEISLNDGTGLGNKFYIGQTNKVNIRIMNDENLNGMSLPFTLSGYSGSYQWKPVDSTGVGVGYKYTRHLKYPPSIWDVGFFEYKGSLNGVAVDTLAMAGANNDPQGAFPSHSTLENVYQWEIYIPPTNDPGEICIDNISFPPGWSWTFAPNSMNNYAPYYFECPNNSPTDPSCPAVCFPVVELQCGNANGIGGVDIMDLVFLVNYVFKDGANPGTEGECDGLLGINMLDIVYLANSLFCAGPPPVCPGNTPECQSLSNPDFVLVHGNVFPAGTSTYSMPIKLSLSSEIAAASLPLRIRIDGEKPTGMVAHSGTIAWYMSGSSVYNDSGVIVSYGFNSCATLSGCNDYGTIDLTMPPQPFDRIISVELTEFEDAKPMIVDDARNCYLPVITGAQFAACNVGTICDGSNTDPVLILCPGEDAVFQVYLRNALGDPVAGDSSVYIDLVGCSGVLTCPPGGELTRLYPSNRSRLDGVLRFYVAAGSCNTSCTAFVTAPCGTIATVPVRSVDTNGDLGVSLGGDFSFTECNNYNGVAGIQIEDQDIFYEHIGHYCGLTPCERFSYQFQLKPGTNLSPGQQVALNLTLRNDNFTSCQIGAIGFFATGFGTGETRALIEVVGYNQALLPGRSDTVSVNYTVPGVGHGCLAAEFTTDCCSTTVVLEQCAQSRLHCPGSGGLCYDIFIKLSQLPVFDVVIPSDYLAPGWSINEIHVPTGFPLLQPDSVKYQICTPVDPELGDDSRVPVEIWYDPLGFSVDVFESQVFMTPRTGDANGNCLISISDVVYLINYIFAGGQAPVPCQAADVNCSGIVNISDAVYIVNFIFTGGASPCLPTPSTPAPTCGR